MPHLTRAVARRVGVALGTLLLLLLLAIPGRADSSPAPSAQEGGDVVVEILPLHGFLDPPTADAIVDLVEGAADAHLIVVQLNAPGTVDVDMDAILEAIEASPVPVAVFVGPQGAAATLEGGAIAMLIAAHVAAAAPDATIGPVHPVSLGGGTVEEAEDLLAKAGLHDDEAAEPLIAGPVAAEDAGTVVDLVVPGLEALLLELDGQDVDTAAGPVTMRLRSDEVNVRFHTLGVVRRLLHAASTGPFIWLLLTVGLGMLLFELFQPGFGVAGIAGVITAAIGIFGLTVLPVTWWAVALVVLGMVLFALDTAIAGFGLVTAAAVVALTVGSANFYQADALALPWWLIAATVTTAFVFFVFVMTSLLRAQAGPAEDAVAELIGRRGVVRSVLNPEGHVFVDGALWRARWADETRAARVEQRSSGRPRGKVGTVVRVREIDGPLVLVEAAEEGADAPSDVASGSSDASSS